LIATLVTLSLALSIYAYFGYPLLLMLLNSREDGRSVDDFRPAPSSRLGIIITVRNEESVMRKKLEDTLALRYQGSQTVAEGLAHGAVELFVASDCSDDGTDSIVDEYASRGVRLVRLPERGGKERAQKAAIAESTADILIFTDAKIQLNEDAPANFVKYFSDATVGAVSSSDRVIANDEGSSGEGLYVRYEMWLREQESKFNSLVGLSGSCFAVRRQIAEQLQVDIPSDFSLLLETQRQGRRGVHAADVIGTYRAVRTEQEEFSRKVRTVLRGITACFARIEVLSIPRFGIFAWQVWSHKIGRWLVPWFLLISFLGSLYLAGGSPFFAMITFALLFLFGFAILGLAEESYQQYLPIKVCVFFCVVNAAIAVAWIKFLSGQRSVAWTPSAK
jgi:cellulose synthase/poly-beta-1,6-N-acetylglucosamine synthase-like glycosyltransferase